MGNLINLRGARKAKARDEKFRTADENAARHGRTKAAKAAEKAASDKAARHLDAHKRDP